VINHQISIVIYQNPVVASFFNAEIVCTCFLWIAKETLDDLLVCHCLIPFSVDIAKDPTFQG